MDAVWAAIIPVCVSILGGGLTMAWKLGSLTTTVKELDDKVDGIEQKFDRMAAGGRRWTDNR